MRAAMRAAHRCIDVDAAGLRLRRERSRLRDEGRAPASCTLQAQVIFVDTCVSVDVLTSDARWRDWSVARLAHWSSRGRLLINPVVFAERCPDFATFEQAEAAVGEFGLLWRKIPAGALFLASRAHLLYRRRV